MGGHILRRAEEDGFTLIELMAALSVLAVGFFALASSLGLGLRQVALGRQRQVATEIANARLEHLRNLAFETAALSTQPVHTTDTNDPDFYVSSSGTSYDVTGHGATEPLIVDATGGQVLHFEDPVTIGKTQLKVYQYVTWVDDANITGTQDYKRITIVVVFKQPSIGGVAQFVRASAFVTTGNVIVTGDGTNPNQGATGSPSPSVSPTPTPTPTGPCAGDITAPSGDFSILSGTSSETGYSASPSVTLSVPVSDGCAPVTATFSNDGTTFGTPVTLVTDPQSIGWTVLAGDGSKSVWGRFSDGNGNTKTTGSYSIVLDTTIPSMPGTLTFTKSCSGNPRTVNLSWGSSTDANFRGYRIYRSINNAAFVAIATSSTSTVSDTQSKSLDSIAYRVVGYDKAGNESNATNTISVSKNQC